VKVVSTRCTTRYQKNIVPAVMKAENRLILTAGVSPNGERSTSHARASTTNSGLPGGWGIPMMCAVAMYSLVSQNAVVGARVTVYSTNSATAAANAHRNGGRYVSAAKTGSVRVGDTRAVWAAWLIEGARVGQGACWGKIPAN
jgi:hypothetical protein